MNVAIGFLDTRTHTWYVGFLSLDVLMWDMWDHSQSPPTVSDTTMRFEAHISGCGRVAVINVASAINSNRPTEHARRCAQLHLLRQALLVRLAVRL